MSSSSACFALDHLSPPPSEQLCYVHCNFCDTVSVPCSSLFKTVTVRCGHCTNLLSVNMRPLLLPAANQLHFASPFFPPTSQSLLKYFEAVAYLILGSTEGIALSLARSKGSSHLHPYPFISILPFVLSLPLSLPPSLPPSVPNGSTRTPPSGEEQRVPSAYNRFIKEEIQRIKAENPDITHREAFSAAAKNWAHFPHIHFGLMSEPGLKKSTIRQPEVGDVLRKEGFHAAADSMGITPF
ncbi:unnamed protein product [Spirodela intermedia]|uniref:Uncharacterized protein n=1 Tax=Spirodela intermedia TaxID=51605 RepID=A0A7I8IZA2_SPIIN|nr:unnamed protein product [Spirodela intermedia]CAA6663306.1 unnamed protein product [Spirodela intermedia]